jgi:hypothetical protein
VNPLGLAAWPGFGVMRVECRGREPGISGAQRARVKPGLAPVPEEKGGVAVWAAVVAGVA